MNHRNSISGFTPAELLIVVAIVAILFLAAIPRHAESQVHTKVVRVHVDYRNIKTALENYHVDYQTYPPATTGAPVFTPIYLVLRYRPLTSPVAYLSTPPVDPFGDAFAPDRPVGPPDSRWNGHQWPVADPRNPTGLYDYWTRDGSSRGGELSPPHYLFPAAPAPQLEYLLSSYGPDKDYDPRGLTTPGILEGVQLPYDPTNGTVSDGNIWTYGPGRFPRIESQ